MNSHDLHLFPFAAVGEATPGASVQKGPAASRQDVYAGTPLSPAMCHPTHKCEHDPSLSPAEQLASIPEFSQLGPLFRSSDKPVELTESETEYVVRCVKHVFSKHMVFQVCSLVCVSAISCTCTVFVVPPDVAQQGPLQDAGFLSSLLSFPCKNISIASLHTLHSCHVPVL